MHRKFFLLLLGLMLCLLPALALGDTLAEDITREVTLSGGSSLNLLRNGSYEQVWESGINHGVGQLVITAPEGKTIGGVVIHWKRFPLAVTIQQLDENGDWVDVASYEGEYYEQYYPVDGLQSIRIFHRDQPRESLKILEIAVFTPGEMPDSVHVWQSPPDKVDLMLLHGHPDDELLWFGGMIPYYTVAQQKEVLVVCAAESHYQRRHELLDALWNCGLRTQPVFLGLADVISGVRDVVLDQWDRSATLSRITELYRRYKPDVVVTHDVEGEYGHGVHRAISYLVRKALPLAADETYAPQQVEAYGVWDVPKAYIHLYAENQIQLDWWQSLPCFDGKTAQDVAREAFLYHRSQQGRGWAVEDHGVYDNSLFGLYRTTVGPDVEGNDLFENLPNQI